MSASITTKFHIIGTSEKVFPTNVYGPNLQSEKSQFLHSLLHLQSITKRANWIMVGDFKIITTLTEKKGGLKKLGQHIECFSLFINQLHMVDLQIVNGSFTSNNHRGGTHQIAS